MPSEKQDFFNVPIIQAGELAYQQVEFFLRLLPNPPGQPSPDARPSRITIEEIRRLSKGE
jgi:hypothetical protein